MLDRAAVGEVAEDIERIGRSNLDIDVLDDCVLHSLQGGKAALLGGEALMSQMEVCGEPDHVALLSDPSGGGNLADICSWLYSIC